MNEKRSRLPKGEGVIRRSVRARDVNTVFEAERRVLHIFFRVAFQPSALRRIEGPHHFRRGAEHERTGEDFRPLRDQGARADQPFAY